MPREMLSTNAPLSAAGSAAQRERTDEDHSSAFAGTTEANRVSAGSRPKLRMVVGGSPVIEPVVESAGRQASEVLVKDWAKDWAEDESEDGSEDDLDSPLDSLDARTEARLDDRSSRAPYLSVVENGDGEDRKSTRLNSSH